MEKLFNDLSGGVAYDWDRTKIPINMLEELYNGRIINKHGKGWVVTEVAGNKMLFQSEDGGKEIGKVEYKGITFYFFHSTATGRGEIGSYPKPNLSTPGFTAAYGALQNLTGGPFAPKMITDKLTFSLDHMIEGTIQEDADGSLNIYFVDGFNQDRVVNTGFKMDGTSNGRTYANASLAKRINLFLDSPFHPYFNDLVVSQGGSHKAGTYIFFARFCTKTYDATPFKGESGPIQISPDDDNLSGTNWYTADGQVADYVTKKRVSFSVRNLDTDYDYFELAYVYYGNAGQKTVRLIDKKFALTGGAVTNILLNGDEPLVEISYADLIRTHPLARTSQTIDMLERRLWRGNLSELESHNDYLKEFASRVLVEYDILDVPITENDATPSIYKSYLQKYDHVGYFHGESYPFAASFTYYTGVETDAYPCKGDDFWNNTTHGTFNSKGIFRFPNLYNEQLVGNSAGHVKNDMTAGYAYARLLCAKFNFNDAITYLNSTPAAKTFFEQNIKGIDMMRGECKRNSIYQGLLLSAYQMDFADQAIQPFEADNNGFGASQWQTLNWSALPNMGTTGKFFTDYKFQKANWRKFPLYRRGGPIGFVHTTADQPNNCSVAAIPAMVLRDKTFSGDGKDIVYYHEIYPGLDDSYISFGTDNNGWPQKCATRSRCLFSFDHMFKKSFPDGDYRMMIWGTYTFRDYYNHNFKVTNVTQAQCDYLPPVIGAVSRSYNRIKPIDSTYVQFLASAYNIYEWEVADREGFVSMFKQGAKDEPYGWFWLESNNSLGAKRNEANRAIATNKYIGLMIKDVLGSTRSIGSGENISPTNVTPTVYSTDDADILNRHVTIYQRDPVTGYDISLLYDPPKTQYFRISNQVLIDGNINNIPASLQCWKGDCYVAGASMKVAFNPDELGVPIDNTGYDDSDAQANSGNQHYEKSKSGFGTTMVWVTENEYNVSMRVQLDGANERYWNWEIDPTNSTFDFLKYSVQNVVRETAEFNTGYNQVLGELQRIGFDGTVPYRQKLRPYAICPSLEYIPGIYTDYLRLADLAAIRDFNSHLGPIVKLVNNYGRLMNIQHRGINYHYINERQTMQGPAGQLVIGTGDVLSPKTQLVMEELGSQHKFSIVKSKSGVYGLDINKRKVWRVIGEQFTNLSVEKKFNRLLHDLFDTALPQSNLSAVLGDTPVNGNGVAAGYNPKYDEVVWTVNFSGYGIIETFVYSEKHDFYQGKAQYYASVYSKVDNDFLGNSLNAHNVVYLHDVEKDGINDNFCVFYGSSNPVQLRFDVIANGAEGQWENIEKEYESWELTCDTVIVPAQVNYESNLQQAVQVPFVTTSFAEFYCKPVVKEDSIFTAIRRADSVTAVQPTYQVKSQFRGKYLLISVRYSSKSQVWAKSIITTFTPSTV